MGVVNVNVCISSKIVKSRKNCANKNKLTNKQTKLFQKKKKKRVGWGKCFQIGLRSINKMFGIKLGE